MRDDPITPIRPIHAVNPVREVEIPRHPSLGQLRTWLRFAKRMAGKRKAGDAAEPQGETHKPEDHPVEHHGPGKWA